MRAEFEAAFDLITDRGDRFSPAFQAADARYRAWIGALDGVALTLLDDLDACEAACAGSASPWQASTMLAPQSASPADIDLLLQELDRSQSATDLIGAAPTPIGTNRANTPKSRAMRVVGEDRVARHWNVSLGRDRPVCAPDITY